jgi:hypothetical protein
MQVWARYVAPQVHGKGRLQQEVEWKVQAKIRLDDRANGEQEHGTRVRIPSAGPCGEEHVHLHEICRDISDEPLPLQPWQVQCIVRCCRATRELQWCEADQPSRLHCGRRIGLLHKACLAGQGAIPTRRSARPLLQRDAGGEVDADVLPRRVSGVLWQL